MHGEYKVPGGKLVVVDLAISNAKLANVSISGDFFLEPDEALTKMNQALEGMDTTASELDITVAVAQALEGAEALGLTSEGVAIAVQRAIAGGTA